MKRKRSEAADLAVFGKQMGQSRRSKSEGVEENRGEDRSYPWNSRSQDDLIRVGQGNHGETCVLGSSERNCRPSAGPLRCEGK